MPAVKSKCHVCNGVAFQKVTAVSQCVCFFIRLHVPQWKPDFALLPCLPPFLWWYLRSRPIFIRLCSLAHTRCAKCASMWHSQRPAKRTVVYTLCVDFSIVKTLFEPWSFGIILIKLPCYSQNGNQVSLKLCQTMSWNTSTVANAIWNSSNVRSAGSWKTFLLNSLQW